VKSQDRSAKVRRRRNRNVLARYLASLNFLASAIPWSWICAVDIRTAKPNARLRTIRIWLLLNSFYQQFFRRQLLIRNEPGLNFGWGFTKLFSNLKCIPFGEIQLRLWICIIFTLSLKRIRSKLCWIPTNNRMGLRVGNLFNTSSSKWRYANGTSRMERLCSEKNPLVIGRFDIKNCSSGCI
jgi:hypothetical protein